MPIEIPSSSDDEEDTSAESSSSELSNDEYEDSLSSEGAPELVQGVVATRMQFSGKVVHKQFGGRLVLSSQF